MDGADRIAEINTVAFPSERSPAEQAELVNRLRSVRLHLDGIIECRYYQLDNANCWIEYLVWARGYGSSTRGIGPTEAQGILDRLTTMAGATEFP